MWSLLLALVLTLIALCPSMPACVAVPSMLAAGIILITWRASVVQPRYGSAMSHAFADTYGARGPAGPAKATGPARCPDRDEGSGYAGGAGRRGCNDSPGGSRNI